MSEERRDDEVEGHVNKAGISDEPSDEVEGHVNKAG